MDSERPSALRAAVRWVRAVRAAVAAGFQQVLVGNKLVAVPLQDAAGKLAPADHEHALVILLQLFHQRDEVAVAADDHKSIDVVVGKSHFQGVERQVDVRAVLVAARRHAALHHVDGVLRHLAAVLAGARPVAISDFADHLAPLLERLEDNGDVKVFPQRLLNADLDVVKINEYCNLQPFFSHKSFFHLGRRRNSRRGGIPQDIASPNIILP